MKTFRNNWENYSEIKEIPSEMAVGAVSKALERAVGDRGNKMFELSNHLGNVLATVSDKKLGRVLDSTSVVAAYYEVQVRSVQDYYAFGWNIPSRKFNTGSYRHGFNGKENDSEVNNGSYDFGARMYDSRVARWWSVDPLNHEYISYSPYNFVSNSPMQMIDPDGARIIIANMSKSRRRQVKTQLRIIKKSKAFRKIYRTINQDKDFILTITDKMTSGTDAEFREYAWTRDEIEGPDGEMEVIEMSSIWSEDYEGDIGGVIFLGADGIQQKMLFGEGTELLNELGYPKDGREPALRELMREEIVHSYQWYKASVGTEDGKYANMRQNLPGIEFEAKTIAGIVRGQLGVKKPYTKMEEVTDKLGKRILKDGIGNISDEEYRANFQEWAKDKSNYYTKDIDNIDSYDPGEHETLDDIAN